MEMMKNSIRESLYRRNIHTHRPRCASAGGFPSAVPGAPLQCQPCTRRAGLKTGAKAAQDGRFIAQLVGVLDT